MERLLLCVPLLPILFTPLVATGRHSHLFFTTITTSDTAYTYPFYYATRYIDDVILYWYDSGSGVVERRAPWFRSANATLLQATIDERRFQASLQNLFQTFRYRVNDTEGFHFLQHLEGCIAYENKSIGTIFSYRYDGKPFLTFHMEDVKWVAEDPRAQYIADIRNRNQTQTDIIKKILVDTCLPHIGELLTMGNCTFNREEQPVVIVRRTHISNSTWKLHCRAYGHYPKNISLTWYKNGRPVPDNLTEEVTLPFPDITYLTWSWVTITPQEEDVYTCGVEHSSLRSSLMVDWRLSGESADLRGDISIGGIIAICLGAILLLVLTVFGSVSLAKSRR